MPNNLELKQRADQFMPTDEQSLLVLQKRADFFAAKKDIKFEEAPLTSYVKFKLGENEQYGIPFCIAKEVIRLANITPLPFVPNYVSGIINHRGLLLTVINLKEFFQLSGNVINNKTNEIIIIKLKNIILGFHVDYIDGTDLYQSERLELLMSRSKKIKTEYILGLHNGKTAILNVEPIINDICKQLNRID
jgi:purine-binding chemotaxis protein CheW